MKRIFIATEINPKKNLLDFFYRIQNALSYEKIKWVDINNLHITLKFIGETEENLIPDIIQKIEKNINDVKQFEIKLKGLGVFPNLRKPRVIWTGIQDENTNLKEIAEKLDSSLFLLGIKNEDREFKPHLTLGRINFLKNTNKLKSLLKENRDIFLQSQIVRNIILFESTLTPQGAIYTPLKIFNLKKA